jgi:hypothetical protein
LVTGWAFTQPFGRLIAAALTEIGGFRFSQWVMGYGLKVMGLSYTFFEKLTTLTHNLKLTT